MNYESESRLDCLFELWKCHYTHAFLPDGRIIVWYKLAALAQLSGLSPFEVINETCRVAIRWRLEFGAEYEEWNSVYRAVMNYDEDLSDGEIGIVAGTEEELLAALNLAKDQDELRH